MEYITLPRTDIKVSQICFGGGQLGGFGWGDYDLKETIYAAEEGIEKGLNFFDTADCYGLGNSELNLGRIIQNRRDEIIVSSKFGVKVTKNGKKIGYDNSVKYIKQAIEGSLRRLNTDYIDLYQVHYWDSVTPIEEVFAYLENLCTQGKIRAYGINNFSASNINIVDYPGFVNCSFEYSLVNREKEKAIQKHINNNTAFFAYGALGQGILSGKYGAVNNFGDKDQRRLERYVNFYGEKLERNLSIVNDIKEMLKNYNNISCSQIALRWIIQKIPNSVIITGIKNTRQLLDNLHVFDFFLTEEEFNRLEESSL